MPTRWLEIETQSLTPIRLGDVVATPHARVVRVRAPFVSGGLVWVKPLWVGVSGNGLPAQRLVVRDVTRTALLGLLGLTIAGGLWLVWAGRKHRSD